MNFFALHSYLISEKTHKVVVKYSNHGENRKIVIYQNEFIDPFLEKNNQFFFKKQTQPFMKLRRKKSLIKVRETLRKIVEMYK